MKTKNLLMAFLIGKLLVSCMQTRPDGWYLVENHTSDSLSGKPILSIDDFQSLKIDSVTAKGTTVYQIYGCTKPEKTKTFADATEKQIGKEIAFVYQGRVLDHPRVNARIESGNWALSFTDSKEAQRVYKDLRQRMGQLADVPMTNQQQMEQKRIYILPNVEPIQYEQHFLFSDLLNKLHQQWLADSKDGKQKALKDYPEFQQLADMGRCITAPLIIQLMLEEYHYLLPLYEAVQDSALCAPTQLKDNDERLEVTLTLFVTKVMKQPRTLFKNDSEKLAAMRELVKEEYRPKNMSDAQLDTILLQYDYDLWKGVLQMNKKR